MFDFDVITGPGPADRRRSEKPPAAPAAGPHAPALPRGPLPLPPGGRGTEGEGNQSGA
jgi:hypothetical protein